MSYKVDLFIFMVNSSAQYEQQVLWESEPPVSAPHCSFGTCLGLLLCRLFPFDHGMLLCTSNFSDLVNQIAPSSWQVNTWCPMVRCLVSTRLSSKSIYICLSNGDLLLAEVGMAVLQPPGEVFCNSHSGAFQRVHWASLSVTGIPSPVEYDWSESPSG